MRMLSVILVLSVGVTLAGQQPIRDNVSVAPVGVSAGIAGVVRDDVGAPVRRASVTVTGDRRFSLSTITDAQGRFALAGLPAGRVTVTARKAGYPPMSYGAARPNRAGSGVFLTEGQQVQNLPLTLMRGGVLTGTVFDEHGQPVPEITLMAWEVRTTLAGERTLDFPSTGGQGVTTDERGTYRIYGLPPGEYTVGTWWAFRGLPGSARIPTDAELQAAFAATEWPGAVGRRLAPPAASAVPPARYNYSRVYLPDEVNPLAAATVTLGAGQTIEGLDLRMLLKPTASLKGLVLGPEGPQARVETQVTLRTPVSSLASSTVMWTGPDGKFGTDALAPGDYTIRASIPAMDGHPALWASADVTASGAEPVPVTLQLAPAMSVAGRVVFEATGTTSAPPPSGLRVSLLQQPFANTYPVATTDASNAFVLPGVAPGRFRVGATLPATPTAGASWMLRSVKYGDREVVDQIFDIALGEPPTLTITFTDRVSELTGTLTDAAGQPAPNYYVIVVPADRQFWIQGSRRIVNTRPDGRGVFVFRSLPPGDYRIAATTDLVPRDLQDASAIERTLAQSAPVTVAVGEKKVFDIRVAQ